MSAPIEQRHRDIAAVCIGFKSYSYMNSDEAHRNSSAMEKIAQALADLEAEVRGEWQRAAAKATAGYVDEPEGNYLPAHVKRGRRSMDAEIERLREELRDETLRYRVMNDICTEAFQQRDKARRDALEEAAKLCDYEKGRVEGLGKVDPELGYPYAAESCQLLAGKLRAIKDDPESSTPQPSPPTPCDEPPGPNHADGCDGQRFTYSGEGYGRVRVCECGAEDQDPTPCDEPEALTWLRTQAELDDGSGGGAFHKLLDMVESDRKALAEAERGELAADSRIRALETELAESEHDLEAALGERNITQGELDDTQAKLAEAEARVELLLTRARERGVELAETERDRVKAEAQAEESRSLREQLLIQLNVEIAERDKLAVRLARETEEKEANLAALAEEIGLRDEARAEREELREDLELLTAYPTPDAVVGELSDAAKAGAAQIRRVVIEPGIIERLEAERDGAYVERNRLVAALSVFWPAWLAHDASEDPAGEWRHLVFVDGPTGQLSWHIHDSALPLFSHLELGENTWDGHSTEEKYERLSRVRCDDDVAAYVEIEAERDQLRERLTAYERVVEMVSRHLTESDDDCQTMMDLQEAFDALPEKGQETEVGDE